MAKTSKSVPQQAASSSSQPAAGTEVIAPEIVVLETAAPEVAATESTATEPAPEPLLKMFIPGDCSIADDFKVEKPSSK